MLRLLFCIAAILPIALIPYLNRTAEAEATPSAQPVDPGYVQDIQAPSLAALSDCEAEDLPVFFRDDDLTANSERFVRAGLDAVKDCGEVDVVIIPVLPADAQMQEARESQRRTRELAALVDGSGADVRVADEPRDDPGSLYLNGRAAILKIEPQTE